MEPEDKFAPDFEPFDLSDEERHSIEPFFTNLTDSVFAVPFLPPEVVGALCSRTSRAKDDLRLIFLNEFAKPFLAEPGEYQKALAALIEFLHRYPVEMIFSNPKGREFYVKWLSQFGDDSIAQMAGTHLVYSGLSQVAIKHLEDMRIGLSPIEKSTRYVDYGNKSNGRYRYYTDPTLKELGLESEYREAMDGLFRTYGDLAAKYYGILKGGHPDEKESVLRTKAYDTVRGLLPAATLSQVSFFGNGQVFEYAMNRSLNHPLGEIRWAGAAAFRELNRVVPAFLRRLTSDQSSAYRTYLGERGKRIREWLRGSGWEAKPVPAEPGVKLLEYDPDGEDKVIAGLLYPELHASFPEVLAKVRAMSGGEKEELLQRVLHDRTARWQKIPRAFENAYLRFEIIMNIGAWRDLHRHRLQTQFREKWHIYLGFDVPPELEAAGLAEDFRNAVRKAEDVYRKIEARDPELAQYASTLSHRLRFVQYQNLRALFWETELRTIPQGHPDYRRVEQEKARLVREAYPLLSKYLLADMNEYDFARRETAGAMDKKEKELKEYLGKND